MKKTYLLVGLIFIACCVQAQIKKGTTLLGGNLSASTSSSMPAPGNVSYKTNSIYVSPSYGRAIKDNLVLGADLDFTYAKSGTNYVPNQTNGIGAGVFLRSYKYLGGGFYIFGQSRLGFDFLDQQSDFPSSTGNTFLHADQKQLAIGASFFPGISYAINPRWQLETSLPNFLVLQYVHVKQSSEGGASSSDGTSNSVSLSTSLSSTYTFSVGLRYFIGG
jgi:hypothetical protein